MTTGFGGAVRRQSVLWVAIAAVVAMGTACGHGGAPTAAPAATGGDRDLATLRNATAPFKDLSRAVAAGYVAEVKDCIVHEHHGAMGYHHINRANIARDLAVDRPQFLLYERRDDGSYRLNGVEFILPYRLWPRDTVAPVLMGRTLKHEDSFQYWYLHVWAWNENPEGTFADFHPAVACPPGAAKVYRPNPPA
ncbi:MAG: hypothetical protein AB7L66_11260 [Gemmatimonadales bacterium]